MARSEIFLRGRLDILIFSAITPQLHVTGEIRRPVWDRLARQDFTSLLNVRESAAEENPGIKPKHYLHIAVDDYHAPSQEQLEQGVDFIRQHIAAGEKVLVHCGAGMGRSVTFVAAYLVSTGIPPARALAWIAKARPFIEPTEDQVEQVNVFAERLTPQHPEAPVIQPVPVAVPTPAN